MTPARWRPAAHGTSWSPLAWSRRVGVFREAAASVRSTSYHLVDRRLHGVGSSPLVQVVHCALLLDINSRVVDELEDGEAEIKRVIRDNSPLLGIAEQRALRIAAMHHETFHSFRVPRRVADGDWCREPSEGHQRELLQT